jgi:pyridoxal phosphate enzyme (YggS family)
MTISDRYKLLLQRIEQAAQRAGRRSEDVTLVAVTKTWPAEVVVAAYQAGLRQFGENRIEELAEKRLAVAELLADGEGIVWHAIGALQSRKTALAADYADVFHALDRFKIARRLSHRLVESKRADTYPLTFFLEVNVSGEESKAGFLVDKWEENGQQRDGLLELASSAVELPGLKAQGLMTMAPLGAEEKMLRNVFSRTRELAKWLQAQRPEEKWTGLSMGMTDDFEIAIEEGATNIRVGRAIFGQRT